MEDKPKNKEKVKEKRKLTLKQRKWLKIYVETGNATEAALQSYDLNSKLAKDREKAAVIGSQNIRKLNIPIEELLEEAGITDVYLVKQLRENLNATRLYGKDAIKHDDPQGRNEAMKIVLKLKGKLIDRVDHTTKGQKMPTPIYGGLSTPDERTDAK